MIDHVREIPHVVQRLIGPGMILGFATPFQDHAAALAVAGIGIVVRKRIADIVYVAVILPEMEVSREHSIKVGKVLALDLPGIGHFYHGIHLEVWQFKVSKHVASLHPGDLFVIIAHQPGRYDHIATLKPVVADVYVGYVSGPFGTVDVATITIVEIVIARYEVHLIKGRAESFQGSQAVLQSHHVDTGSVMTPVAQEQGSVTALAPGQVYEPIHELLTVLIVNHTV